jgi:hypothetical protein
VSNIRRNQTPPAFRLSANCRRISRAVPDTFSARLT